MCGKRGAGYQPCLPCPCFKDLPLLKVQRSVGEGKVRVLGGGNGNSEQEPGPLSAHPHPTLSSQKSLFLCF